MNRSVVKYIGRFVILILLQVLVFNNMNLSGYINPSVYILFILLLPVNINKSSLLLLAFLTGITIDYFSNTLGLHASATVFMAFARPGVLNLFFNNLEFTGKDEPNPAKIGIRGFLRYALVMVVIHHSLLFILETLSFNDFAFTLYRIGLSSLVSTFIITIIVLLFSRRT